MSRVKGLTEVSKNNNKFLEMVSIASAPPEEFGKGII
jgi:hypothetical protein